jgi:hypothetical protein
MFSLITGNFEAGPARSRALWTISGYGSNWRLQLVRVVGGLLTTYASWRLGFAAEEL